MPEEYEPDIEPTDPKLVEPMVPTGIGERGLELTEREIKAVELRKAGFTFQEIADNLGWEHKSSAMRAVRRALARWGTESVHELRILEMSRLDTITQKLWPKIIGRPARGNDPGQAPDIGAMMAYLKVSARRARLLGIDSPEYVDLYLHDETGTSTESERLVNDLERFFAIIDSMAEERALPAGSEYEPRGEVEGSS